MDSPNFHSDCFACGTQNAHGLRMQFTTQGTRCTGTMIVGPRFQGYHGLAQGGIVATMLDSVMVHLLHDLFGGNPLTGRLNIRYLGTTPVDMPLAINAWFIDRHGDVCRAEAEIIRGTQRCAAASGVFKLVREV
jgi:acyl-coenzyme A thioesterase PaaI-like protein